MKSLLFLVLIPLTSNATPLDPILELPNETSLSSDRLLSSLSEAKAYGNPLPTPDVSKTPPSGTPTVHRSGAIAANTDKTRAFGDFSIPYTSKRVSHLHTTAISSRSTGYLSATYPYRAVGKLTFNANGYMAYCSASLIRRSILVTAAHCVQQFGGNDATFTDFIFTPASYAGQAPYGKWPIRALIRPASWADGSDKGAGTAVDNDIAVMAVEKNNEGDFIGDTTGYLNYGWDNYSFVRHYRTGNLWIAALTTLGYPSLLDRGAILQRTDGPAFLTTINKAGQMYQGNNLTSGASGGPWVANFGYENPTFSSEASAGNEAISNVVVGVTSWAGGDPNHTKYSYSSQFRRNSRYPDADYGGLGGGNIGALIYQLCAYQPNGSTQTFQQMGYCE